MNVGEETKIGGVTAVVVQSHAKAVGFVKMVANVDDTFTSWIDVATGRPLRWTADEYATKTDDKERTEVKFSERAGDQLPATFHLNDAAPAPEPQRVSMPETWDFNSFLVALRSWEGAPGTKVTVEVFRSRYLWHLEETIGAKEKLTTALGDLPALRFDGRVYKLDRNGVRVPDSDERRFSIWISDDDGRVPLQIVAKTDYGDMKMEITDYQPGQRPAIAQLMHAARAIVAAMLVAACGSSDNNPHDAATIDGARPDAAPDAFVCQAPGSAGAFVRDPDNPSLRAGHTYSDGLRDLNVSDPNLSWDDAAQQFDLYYMGAHAAQFSDPGVQQIHHATSPDGSAWTISDTPALVAASDGSAWDHTNSETPSVAYNPDAPAGRQYVLAYSGANGDFPGETFASYAIGVAFSADGQTFTRVAAAESPHGEDGLVLTGSDAYPTASGAIVADPEIVYVAGTYHLWFSSFACGAACPTATAFGVGTRCRPTPCTGRSPRLRSPRCCARPARRRPAAASRASSTTPCTAATRCG